jgi:hypothetical protein
VWCPNIGFNHDYRALYPGNAYVDWTCLDGYNWGLDPHHRPLNHPWQSFDQLFGPYYHEIVRIAPNKPMVLGELASSEFGGSKSAWIRSTLSRLPSHYPRIRGFVWLDVKDSEDWRVETSGSSKAAFVQCIAGNAFAPNLYANLAATPIPPPAGSGGRVPCS